MEEINLELIDSLATRIRAKGMEAPAIFALEMYKPLAGMFYNLSLALYPALTAILGADKLKETAALLKSPQAVEKLILSLEGKASRA